MIPDAIDIVIALDKLFDGDNPHRAGQVPIEFVEMVSRALPYSTYHVTTDYVSMEN